jgi:glycosyltransferase involved in cell wall biosynthesis
MKIAFTTTFDAQDVNNWSGTPYYMSKFLKAKGDTVHYIGNLKRHLPFGFKATQFLKKLSGQRESPRFNTFAANDYSRQVAEQLKEVQADVVLSPRINPIAYLDCKQPIVLWTDALYASLVAFYPQFGNHSKRTLQQGNAITKACLDRCRLAIFSSEWAARTAREIYGTAEDKIRVVPFGANITEPPALPDILKMLASRPRDRVRLLFIGKHWHRKGGDIVFDVANSLQRAGQAVELHFVGCQPPKGVMIPPYIHCHGFISKRTAEGHEKITRLLSESHFLFVPSRAEAFGIVFCEANAFGLPAISTHVGGIPGVIRNHVNGMTFSLEATPEEYADYIQQLIQDYSRYEALALSAYNEFVTRLNWQTATAQVRELIQSI